MRATLQHDLDQLEHELHGQGEQVRLMLSGAMSALSRSNVAAADVIICADVAVDAAYLEIEEGIHNLLARQNPVAVDLRLALTLLYNNLHLERMADYCVTIAKLTILMSDLPSDRSLVDRFTAMAAQADTMITVALGSFARRDVIAAESLVQLDEAIDHANHNVIDQILSLGADPAARELGLRMLMISRSLERIGDHAVDIGERTAYLVTGEFHEFSDASVAVP